ncbi:MAG: ThiF family adenylyltransferase, partial [Rhodococcus sp.]|nr:ThiF family adenylyltransferase [Rhodococcus sp. (in: high G+C Gram-positive bacteria)]
GPEDIGRFKVDAVANLIQRHQPRAEVMPLRYDVIEHADLLRPVLDDIDVVVCCVDGVAARQAMTHLCALASTPAVFACVLDDGALGEIVRLPARDDVGCLRCLRRSLEHDGSIDPEPSLDLEYGTGTSHRPMTAIAGDLNLMGSLAAKAAASAYLESRGHRDQRWAGDHLVVGLRPDTPFEAPFDQGRVLDVTATTAAPPDPDCPLCSDDRRFD